jgi:DNA-binding transcriptional MerR regulator
MGDTYTLAELVAETGLSERTIRYYIAQKLVAGPLSQGRTAAYSEGHLRVLQRIQELKMKGHTLNQIRHEMMVWNVPSFVTMPGHSGHEVPEPENWQRYRLAGDVQVDVNKDATPQRKHQIGGAMKQFAQAIHLDSEDEGEAR